MFNYIYLAFISKCKSGGAAAPMPVGWAPVGTICGHSSDTNVALVCHWGNRHSAKSLGLYMAHEMGHILGM